MKPWVAVAIGSGLGAAMRFTFSLLVPHVLTPWGEMTFLAALLPTSLVNAMGALAIGGYAERFGLLDMPSETPPGRFFFMAGFLGGFTTFSVFSLEMIMLVREGHGTWAIGYGALSLFVWIVAVWVGSWLARTSAQTPPLPDLP